IQQRAPGAVSSRPRTSPGASSHRPYEPYCFTPPALSTIVHVPSPLGGSPMPELSRADHRSSPPKIDIPRDYNAAYDLIQLHLAAGLGDKVAFIDDAGRCTYAELDRRSSRFANMLRQMGLEMEQRILLCMHDTIDFPVAFLGAIKAGVVPVAVNTLLTQKD